jgi:WD40 repeat protein
VVVVVGPSGAGKSSLVRAGVAARLRRDGADVVVVTPGARPSDALTALPDGGRAVLVVDQCEEVVALCDDAAERSAFLDAVADHGRRAPVVIALRADRLGDLSEYPAFARLVERGLYLLPPMSGDALRAAIERPAEQAGLLVEPGLVDLLVREVEHEPGALPLLSHALRTTWERREGRTLTVAGYTDAGGIRGAVAQTAEAVWDRVPERRQQVLRDLLLRMVSQADDGAPVRARLSRQVIVDDVGHAELVELLVAERLVTSDGEHLELAHEAVIRAWPRLQAWLTDDAIGQRILRHLSLAADTWEQMGCPDSELYRGVRLAQAVEWRDRAGPHLTPVEASFLDASVALDAAHRRETQQRAARQARVNRRLRLLLAGVGVLSVVALAAGMLAARQAGRAQDAAVAADARRVGAQALAADDIDTALLLAVEGVRLDDSRDTRANLLATLGRSPQLVEAIRGEGQGAFGNVSISPDGMTIAVYDDANRLWFYDAGTRAVRATVEFDDSGGTAALVTGGATFHPDDGPVAATSSAIVDRPVKLLDPQTFDELPAQFAGFPGRHLLAWDAVYSPDGRHLAVAFDRYADGGVVQDSQVVVWDLAQPGEPRHVLEVPLFTHGLAFSPDGEQLYTGRHAAPLLADEPSVTVYDVDSGEVGRNMALPSYPLALSPDGTTIAAAAEDGTSGTAVVLADAATGEPVTRLRGHTGTVLDIAFSPDGAQIASSSADRTVILWDTDAAEQRRQFRGHASAVPAVVFDPSSETLISSGADRALLRWDRSGGGQFAPVRTANSAPRAGGSLALSEAWAYVSPDGGRVAYVRAERNPYGSQLTTVQVLDVDSGQLTPAVDTAHGAFLSLSWHPDGDRFATTGGEGIVREWDPRTARIVREGRNALASQGIAYLGAGDDIVVSDPLGAVQLIAGDTLTPGDRPLLVDDFEGEYGLAWAYASSDGRTVALLGRSQLGVDPALASNVFIPEDQLALVDVIDRETAARVELGFDAELAAFSPDGERLAITGRGGQLALVDIAKGTVVRRPPIGHDGNIVSVSFARDGATIATGGQDGRVSLWDGHTGALLSSATVGRPDAAAYAGFRPDGHTVSVANWDGEVYELDTRIERWIEFACEVAGRDLTQAEWRETFRDRPYRATCPGRS